MSISDIAARTGLTRYAVWKSIKTIEKEIHRASPVPYDRWRKGKKRTGARPPFGFCILEGELMRDPKEYPSLLLIFKLWTRGSSVTSIVLHLAEKGLRSRTGKDWTYKVVQTITKRIDAQEILMDSGKLRLSDKFLKRSQATKKIHKLTEKDKGK